MESTYNDMHTAKRKKLELSIEPNGVIHTSYQIQLIASKVYANNIIPYNNTTFDDYW